VTNRELVERISQSTGVPMTKVRKVLQQLAIEILETTQHGEPVKLKGLGRFESRTIKPRMMFGRMTRGRDTLRFKPYGERHGKVQRCTG